MLKSVVGFKPSGGEGGINGVGGPWWTRLSSDGMALNNLYIIFSGLTMHLVFR